MTLQEMAEIAARHETRMADAMLLACVERALETGEPLLVPERGGAASGKPRKAPGDDLADAEWERLQRGNSDTRWCHV